MTKARTVEQPDEFPFERSEFRLRGPVGLIECAADVPDVKVFEPFFRSFWLTRGKVTGRAPSTMAPSSDSLMPCAAKSVAGT